MSAKPRKTKKAATAADNEFLDATPERLIRG